MSLWSRMLGNRPAAEPRQQATHTARGACDFLRTTQVPAGKNGSQRPCTTSIAVSADGTIAVTGHADGMVRVWNPFEGTLLHSLDGHEWGDVHVDLSADGAMAASACRGGTFCLWDVSAGSLVRSMDNQKGSLQSVSLGASLALAATNRDGNDVLTDQVVLWNLATGRRLRELDAGEPGTISVAMSATETAVAVGTQSGRVVIVDLSHEGKRFAIDAHPSAKPYGAAARFSANGCVVVSHGKIGWGAGSSYDNVIKVWDAVSGECLASLAKHANGVTGAALSDDGSVALSTGQDKSVYLWDVLSRTVIAQLDGHQDGHCAALSGNATTIVSGGFDDPMRFWRVRARPALPDRPS